MRLWRSRPDSYFLFLIFYLLIAEPIYSLPCGEGRGGPFFPSWLIFLCRLRRVASELHSYCYSQIEIDYDGIAQAPADAP